MNFVFFFLKIRDFLLNFPVFYAQKNIQISKKKFYHSSSSSKNRRWSRKVVGHNRICRRRRILWRGNVLEHVLVSVSNLLESQLHNSGLEGRLGGDSDKGLQRRLHHGRLWAFLFVHVHVHWSAVVDPGRGRLAVA